MRTTVTFSLMLMASMLAAGSVSAQTLYGIAFEGPDGPATLHTINPATGAATAVGAVGFERCSGMDFGLDGVLYAACERSDGSDTPVLVSVDLTTGVGTEIGPTGLTGAVSDLSFRADGVLFAYDATNNPDHSLFTINTNTGAGTLVGDTGLDFAGGNAMAFDLTGDLYHSQFTDGPGPDLNTLDPATGLPTFVGQLTDVTGRFSAFETDPATGELYAVLNEGAGGSGPTSLAIVDPVGLGVTLIGLTENTLDAIAFAGEAPPGILEIPTLGPAGLLSLILALALGGWWVSTRRRQTR